MVFIQELFHLRKISLPFHIKFFFEIYIGTINYKQLQEGGGLTTATLATPMENTLESVSPLIDLNKIIL